MSPETYDRCSIAYHVRMIDQGKTTFDRDLQISLKAVQEVVVQPLDQVSQQSLAKTGHPEMAVTVSPQVFEVSVKFPKNIETMLAGFFDETLAERVSKALQHAMELCGGGNKTRSDPSPCAFRPGTVS